MKIPLVQAQAALLNSGIQQHLSDELVEQVIDGLTCTDTDDDPANILGSQIWSAAVSIANERLSRDDDFPTWVASDDYFTVQSPDHSASASEQRQNDVLELALELLPAPVPEFIRSEQARRTAEPDDGYPYTGQTPL